MNDSQPIKSWIPLFPRTTSTRSSTPALILVGVGLALLIWGFTTSDGFTTQPSRLFPLGPSNKAIVLLIAGSVVGGFGLVRLLRHPTA